MPSYTVIVLVDASVGIEVEAESAEQAAEEVFSHDRASPSLCHECSGKLDLGDQIGVIVSDGDREVYDDTPHEYQRQRAEMLQAKLAHANQVVSAAKLLVERLPVETLARCFDTNTEHEKFALLLREVTQ